MSGEKKQDRKKKENSRKGRTRVLVGPPEEKSRRERPVRLTANKVYFHEWAGSDEEEQEAGKQGEASKKRRRRKR